VEWETVAGVGLTIRQGARKKSTGESDDWFTNDVFDFAD
jgi:hypothetical protein